MVRFDRNNEVVLNLLLMMVMNVSKDIVVQTKLLTSISRLKAS